MTLAEKLASVKHERAIDIAHSAGHCYGLIDTREVKNAHHLPYGYTTHYSPR